MRYAPNVFARDGTAEDSPRAAAEDEEDAAAMRRQMRAVGEAVKTRPREIYRHASAALYSRWKPVLPALDALPAPAPASSYAGR